MRCFAGRAEEHGLCRAAMGHAAVEPVERLEPAGHPAEALLGEHDAQARVPFEHTAEDEVPRRAVRVPRELDEHDCSRRLGVSEVGQTAPGVDVQRDVELLAQVPERLVDRIPQWWDLGVGWDVGKQDPSEHVHVLPRPPDLCQRVVEVVQEHLRASGAPRPARREKSASQRLCACSPAQRDS